MNFFVTRMGYQLKSFIPGQDSRGQVRDDLDRGVDRAEARGVERRGLPHTSYHRVIYSMEETETARESGKGQVRSYFVDNHFSAKKILSQV